MNKFQNDKRKALNREYARFYYLLQKFNHIAFKISQVRSPKRAIKLSYQLVLTHTKIIVVRAQIITIQLQPIPRFPSGGVHKGGFSLLSNRGLLVESGEPVIMDGAAGAGKHFAHFGIDVAKIGHDKTPYTEYKDGKVSKIDFSELAEALRNHKPKTDDSL